MYRQLNSEESEQVLERELWKERKTVEEEKQRLEQGVKQLFLDLGAKISELEDLINDVKAF